MSHRMVLWNCINLLQRDLLPTDVVLWHLPVYYTGGLHGFTLPALFAGAKVVSVPRWNPGDVFDAIERERVTILFGVPTQLLAMMDSPRMATSDLRSLRYVMSGGAPCPIPLIERFAARGLRFRQALGMTEVGPHCFAQEPDDAFRKPGSVGHPFLSIRHRIVDTEGRDVEPGQVGELWLSSPAMMDGYWNDPDATARAFQDDWFRSGDQVRQDIEGDLYVVGRTKDMLIRGGENVYPAEVESLLHAHPGVLEAAVIGVPHPTWGEVGMALVVRRPDASVSEGDLLAYCRERLARFKVPESAVFVEALPRTASGKVRKADLAALYGVR